MLKQSSESLESWNFKDTFSISPIQYSLCPSEQLFGYYDNFKFPLTVYGEKK